MVYLLFDLNHTIVALCKHYRNNELCKHWLRTLTVLALIVIQGVAEFYAVLIWCYGCMADTLYGGATALFTANTGALFRSTSFKITKTK